MSELKISFCESLAFRYYVKPRSQVRSPRENMQIGQPKTTPWTSVIGLQFWPLNNVIFYRELHYLPDQSVLKPHFAFLLASSRRPSWREAILTRTLNHTATPGTCQYVIRYTEEGSGPAMPPSHYAVFPDLPTPQWSLLSPVSSEPLLSSEWSVPGRSVLLVL